MRSISFAPGEWYHCYNRGVDKRTIFTEPDEYRRFQMLLYAANNKEPIVLSNFGKRSGGPTLELVMSTPVRKPLVQLVAYSLMPNHYHLLIHERGEGGITSFMRKVDTGYTMYFNIKQKRAGVLFSGKFKARHVSDDRYLRRVVNYIHANPAELFEPKLKLGIIRDKRSLEKRLREYPYSSFPDYQSARRVEQNIVDIPALRNATDVDVSFNGLVDDAIDFARADTTF